MANARETVQTMVARRIMSGAVEDDFREWNLEYMFRAEDERLGIPYDGDLYEEGGPR